MKNSEKPLLLKNAPLQYAPKNELGVVFLFAHVAKRLQFRIEEIRPAFPDCIAYRHAGESEKEVRIEFEFKSSNFKAHGHSAKACDCIVCWHHDWPDIPNGIEVIELKRFFGTAFKVWVQVALKSQWHWLEEWDEVDWALSKRVTPGDLLLMYRAYPSCSISEVFRYAGFQLQRGKASWRDGNAHFGRIVRVCNLDAPIFLGDLRRHRVLRTSSFVRRNMQGRGLLVSEYWPYLYGMIYERNPKVRKILSNYAPETV